MKHGVSAFATDSSLSAPSLAKEVEDRGFDSLWLPEHSHLPVEESSDPDSFYARLYDPFIALAAAAAATTTLGLATGVSLVAQRDPIYTAKQVASLDHLSGAVFSWASARDGTESRCGITGSIQPPEAGGWPSTSKP